MGMMQLYWVFLLSQLLLTVLGSKDNRVNDGVTEMPVKRTMYKAVRANVWDMQVPVKNESGKNGLPRDDANKFEEVIQIDTGLNKTDLPDNFQHQDHWDVQHTIYNFDTHCQKDVRTMDSYCTKLLVKLRHRMKIELELPDLRTRQMKSKVLCVSTSPITIDWYDPTQDLCCKGIHRKVTGKEMCCGAKTFRGVDNRAIYDKNQQLCCDGALYNKTKPYQLCCGRYVYDSRYTTACCNGILYDRRRKFCCKDKTLHHNIGRHNRNGKCCGAEKFDDRCYSCINDAEIGRAHV